MFDIERKEVSISSKLEDKIRFLKYFEINNEKYLVSAVYGNLTLFSIKNELISLQTLNFKKNYLEACESIFFKEDMYVIVSTCDNLAHILQFDLKTKQFVFLNSLPGHLNKIKVITKVKSD